jgi:hypothetical protein
MRIKFFCALILLFSMLALLYLEIINQDSYSYPVVVDRSSNASAIGSVDHEFSRSTFRLKSYIKVVLFTPLVS